ncbi:MAG TPA: prephenate dehydratase [Solirubrobacterales bacterium]|jgi:prephenate dehydratase|nr:prephenate dehydratase [Solirubrobacterales bacterium]
MRIAYLGPAGTFTEDALREAAPAGGFEPLRTATIHEAILAVERGEAERALVPVENSIEGSVRPTLDALAFDAPGVTIVGEYDYAVREHLIAREPLELAGVEAVLSHPQPLAQCARFLREQLPGVELRSVSSTAAAVRMVAESVRPWAAVGSRAAADLYGCAIVREGIEDEADNVTRFVWIAPEGTEPEGGGPWKTSLVFSELGEDHPGALVDALAEFSSRRINLSRIESRPLRQGLGRYMFFCDLEGAAGDEAVAAAIDGLRGKAESVRILGSYPVDSARPAPSR